MPNDALTLQKVVRTFCSLILVFTTSKTLAFTVPVPCGFKNSNFDMLTKVAVMGQDERMTYDDYARKKKVPVSTINKKFEATGVFICWGIRSTAQLTGKGNVITTAGHAFTTFECDRRSVEDLEPCYFIHNPGPHEKYYYVRPETVKIGGCENRHDDWAVAQLKEPVPNVKPYDLPEDNFEFRPDENVIFAAGANSDFWRNNKTPRTLTECKIRDVYLDSQAPLRTDCDSGKSSSGGAQLIESNSQLKMISINIGRPNKRDSSDLKGQPYDSENYYNVAVPLRGEFLHALKTTIENAK